MKYAPLAVVFLLMTANISCSTGNDVETPQASVPDINKSLTVAAPPEANVFKIGEPLSILIQNQTERQIFVRPEDAVLIEQSREAIYVGLSNILGRRLRKTRLSMQVGQSRAGTGTLSHNAEGRLTGVSGSTTATFVYDGDGMLVKSTINSVSTIFVGNYYEKTGSTITKYYYAPPPPFGHLPQMRPC